MSDKTPPFTVIQGGLAKPAAKVTGEISSPDKPPGDLSTQERRVWDYICARLREAGIDHTTFGLAGMIVAKTYIRWVQAEAKLEQVMADNGGSYLTTTPNGYEQPHQIFYAARDLKKELLAWLPECALTIPSLATIRAKAGDQSQQDDLFADLVNHAANRPSVSSG
jgi:hypothetical protein